jgi:hypothetical protein
LTLQDYNSPTPGCVIKTQNPSWADVEQAIRSLDAKQRSNLGLDITEDEYMAIGGGDGVYICQVFPEMYRLLNPAVPEHSKERVSLVVGDVTDLWARECVPLQLVLKAAKRYYETGEMDESLIWDQYA